MRPATTKKVIPVLGPDTIPVDHLVTEDDTPVDSYLSEREQRILVDILYASWKGPGKGRPFFAMANVGLFYSQDDPPLVPDFMMSLDIRRPPEPGKPPYRKRNRSYFTWVYHKVPEVAIEIVSNRDGGEDDEKLALYAQIGIVYYVIHDPDQWLSDEPLRLYRLQGKRYQRLKTPWLTKIGLGLKLWWGEYEGIVDEYLRWCNRQGQLLPTGEERAARAGRRAMLEKQRAEQEKQRADRLAEQLRKLGIKPEE